MHALPWCVSNRTRVTSEKTCRPRWQRRCERTQVTRGWGKQRARTRSHTQLMVWATAHSVSRSVKSDSLWPHGQPARLLCPWDLPGKNTGVGCHFLLQGSSQPRDQTLVSYIAGAFFTIGAAKEPPSRVFFKSVVRADVRRSTSRMMEEQLRGQSTGVGWWRGRHRDHRRGGRTREPWTTDSEGGPRSPAVFFLNRWMCSALSMGNRNT